MATKKVKTKLSKPTVSLSRDGYKFILSFSNIDSDSDYIRIIREVWEKQDTKKSSNQAKEHKEIKLGAKKNSSWSYTLDKNKYYPYVSDGGDNNNKQSDLNQRISKVIFKVWVTGKNSNGTTIKSETITKTYKFDAAVKPNVAISYNEDGTSFTYAVDINDDYGIDDNSKKVATRSWVWLTSQTKGGREVKVSGHTGKWYDRDISKNIRNKITTSISPSIPIEYVIHAYSAGPGGKSETKTANHIFAVPKAPLAPTKITKCNILQNSDVDAEYGLYDLEWNIDTGSGWYPVDTVTIQYRDQTEYKGASDIYGENMGSWSTAKGNIHSSIRKIRTDDIGAPADDTVRYFRILAEHDGNQTPGYVSGVVGYGHPENVSGVSVTQSSVSGKQVLVFKWSAPTSKLYGTDPSTKYYDGGLLGEGGILRICISKNVETNVIRTIEYGSKEWENCEWVYTIPDSDLDKEVDYCFQVRVGRDNLKPGGRSNNLWVNNIVVPSKCTNVVGTKQANNTTVEVTWDNPIKTDTIRNGIEIAWSPLINVFETNQTPNSATFENGAMNKAYIVGLTAGEVYYFWVRRYEKTDSGTNYGVWSDPSNPVILSDKPETPILTTSRSWVKQGGSLTAQWVYYASGGIPQTSAQIEISTDKNKWTTLTTVTGEETHCDVNLGKRSVGDYYLRVTVNNSMGSTSSENIEVTIADNPTCALTSSSIVDYSYETEIDNTGEVETTTAKTLRSLPFNVNVSGDGDLNLYVYCADNFENEHPDSTDIIYSGDCIWTSAVEEGDYVIENIHLVDNCKYRLQLECVDPDTNLKAEAQYIDFEVHWENQAVAPINSTVLINEDGSAILTPVKPKGASDTDVCDIYRTTVDGRHICRRDVIWGQVVTDILPTFSDIVDTSYCFCTRTTDGNEAWVDIDYDLSGTGMIINYGESELKLPWNMSIDDNRTKQGEVRAHLGGTKLYFGQPYIERSQSLKTEVIKVENEDLIEKLYELSRYSEICYIRTSDGIGYPATIDVSISREYNNQIVSVSLSATETDGDDEFLGSVSD